MSQGDEKNGQNAAQCGAMRGNAGQKAAAERRGQTTHITPHITPQA